VDFTLKEYEKLAKKNAYAMIGAIEFIKNSYSPNMAGSEGLGHLLAFGRNAVLDLIESSDLVKYNFM